MTRFFPRIILIVVAALLASLALSFAAATESHAARAYPLVAVGDSIVQGVGTSDPDHLSWPARIGAVRTGSSGGCVVANNCFGQTPMIQQFDSAVLPLLGPGSKLVVAYGINDIASGSVTDYQIVDALANLVYRARQAGAKVYVQTLIPMGPRMWFMDAARRSVNQMIRARFANVIDQDQLLLNSQNGMIWAACDSGDNLHPNSEGYRRMASVARSAMGL